MLVSLVISKGNLEQTKLFSHSLETFLRRLK